MKALILAASALLLIAADQPAEPSAAATAPAIPRGAALAGAWTVDLRVSEGDAPYNQPMNLTIAADGVVSGDFYNSTISSGRYGRNMGRECVAFVTSDGMGDYQHSACLVDGRMLGQSWAEHRRFLLPWIATRVVAATP